MIDSLEILGVKVEAFTPETLLARIEALCLARAHALVLNVNIHALNLSYEQLWLRGLLNSAENVFCDGAGVRLGAWLLGRSLPPRITYADFMWDLAGYAEQHNLSLYFLGAAPGIVEKAVKNLHLRFPGLMVAGMQHGFFDMSPGSAENRSIVDSINVASPDILLVAFGMPLQEKWLLDNWPKLRVGVALTGGAVFDYISGELRRAPRWMTDHGLEWLGRLILEPHRLWRRYIIGNVLFAWRIFAHHLLRLPLPN